MHLDLVTTEGPSWKPLPVLFTTPFSLFGDDAAPALWLVVARAGGVLAFAMAFRLGARLAGRWAGAIAALSLVLADEFIRDFARGNSEGLLVALVPVGDRAPPRRPPHARRSCSASRPRCCAPRCGRLGPVRAVADADAWRRLVAGAQVALVVGCGLLALVLWFVPEYLGLRRLRCAPPSARAQPNPDSAAFAVVAVRGGVPRARPRCSRCRSTSGR